MQRKAPTTDGLLNSVICRAVLLQISSFSFEPVKHQHGDSSRSFPLCFSYRWVAAAKDASITRGALVQCGQDDEIDHTAFKARVGQ
jgi:hypothetical protein